LGKLGEDAAAQYLSDKGYHIMERNFRSKTGEIDIIAEISGSIVFIEVKTRRSTRFGTAAEAVTPRKRHKIINTAFCYLKKAGDQTNQTVCRIDVIEVYIIAGKPTTYHHIINAFSQ
jgi:putative endonuclease